MGMAAAEVNFSARPVQHFPNQDHWLLRILTSRFGEISGVFSYSIYLLHLPIILAVQACLLAHPLPVGERILGLTLSAPLAVGLAYIFHRIFERPFMSRRPLQTECEAEQAAIFNPAP